VNMRKAAGWILLVIAVTAVVVVSVGFSRNRADQHHAVAYVQSTDVWQARQRLLWQEVDVVCDAQVAQQERILQTAEAEEAADVAAVEVRRPRSHDTSGRP
jgi:hypothetical protein